MEHLAEIFYLLILLCMAVIICVGFLVLLVGAENGDMGIVRTAVIVCLFVVLPLAVAYFILPLAGSIKISLTPGMLMSLIAASFCVVYLHAFIATINYLRRQREFIKKKQSSLETYRYNPVELPLEIARMIGRHTGQPEEAEESARRADEAFAAAETEIDFTAAFLKLEHALREFSALVEVYPDIKQDGEIRSAAARLLDPRGEPRGLDEKRDSLDFAVLEYNQRLRTFPGSILARLFGFGLMEYSGKTPDEPTSG